MIIEAETGARFVYRDGVLYLVLNQASALLILGSASGPPVVVPRSALADVPRGTALGIPGAPDSLPAAADLVTGAWSLCSRPTTGDGAAVADGGGGDPPVGAERPIESVLAVGVEVATTALADAAVLAEDPFAGLHMLWHGRRYPVQSPAVVAAAFGWSGRSPTPVPAAVLNAIPVGPSLTPIVVSGLGAPSVLPGREVGDVLVVSSEGGERQYAMVQASGLADITQVQADLLLADPANRLSGPSAITAADYVAAPRAESLVPTGDNRPPARTPELVGPPAQGGVCASFRDAGAPPAIGLAAPSVSDGGSGGSSGLTGLGEVRVDRVAGVATVDVVRVAPGRGAVVESIAGGSASGPLALVSDRGIRFPLASAEVLATLGYADVRPLRLPSALVALLPAGRPLDPVAALRPAGALVQ